MILTKTSNAAIEGRTIFTKRLISTAKPLKSAKNNSKLSKSGILIKKGKYKGLPMYSLTLEERKTCPSSCKMWLKCYGNNMWLAYRFVYGKDLERDLKSQVEDLNNKHKKGFVIRLHILGDFYSVSYVSMWARLMEKYPTMIIFGYSARLGKDNDKGIYTALVRMREKYLDRWYVRFSVNKTGRGKQIFAADESFKGKGFHCPEQDGKTEACNTCMACLHSTKTVIFKEH